MRPCQPDLRCAITKMPFIYNILFCSLHLMQAERLSPSFLLQISHSFFSILTVSTFFPFSVLMALLASHCFSLYSVSLSFFFFLNSFYGADCLFLTTRRKKILIFLCIWLMICNENMHLLNGY